jgi:hypothetical protein
LGLLNKSSSTTNEQKLIVKNTKRDGVLLTIHEHVPKSTDEKIKVIVKIAKNTQVFGTGH